MATISLFTVDAQVSTKFAGIDSSETLRIDLSADNGDWFGALAAYRTLAARSGSVVTQNLGLVGGAAILIFLAGRKRIVPANAVFAFTPPMVFAAGQGEELRDKGEAAKALRDEALRVIASRSNLSQAQIVTMMEGTKWLDARGALSAGIATQIVEPVRLAANVRQPPKLTWPGVAAAAWRNRLRSRAP